MISINLKGQSIQFTGSLVDGVSEEIIQNAHLLLINDEHQYNTISDSLGFFNFINIYNGTYKLIISHLNYDRLEKQINITSDQIENIRLNSISNELEELNIVALEKNTQVNEMNQVSTNIFSLKFAQKFPAVLDGSGRIVTLFAGVQGGKNDAQNDVTVRSNNPDGDL